LAINPNPENGAKIGEGRTAEILGNSYKTYPLLYLCNIMFSRVAYSFIIYIMNKSKIENQGARVENQEPRTKNCPR